MSKKPRIQINYKSGHSMVFECDELTLKKSLTGSGLSSISSDGADPRPMFFGLDDIESVWEL